MSRFLTIGRTYRHKQNWFTILDVCDVTSEADAIARSEKLFPLYTNVAAVAVSSLPSRARRQVPRIVLGYTQFRVETQADRDAARLLQMLRDGLALALGN